jgi:gentisate 1,2-dioxygenase
MQTQRSTCEEAGNRAGGVVARPSAASGHASHQHARLRLVMTGKSTCALDDSEVHLKAGDIVIQRGTNHAWVNRGDKPCRIAFVLLDAKE